MQILAVTNAAATTAERLSHIPREFWLKFALGVVIIVVAAVVVRKVAHVNKAVLTVIAAFAISVVGFNWIYERNEPTWASPAVQFLSGFFPSKGKVAAMHN